MEREIWEVRRLIQENQLRLETLLIRKGRLLAREERGGEVQADDEGSRVPDEIRDVQRKFREEAEARREERRKLREEAEARRQKAAEEFANLTPEERERRLHDLNVDIILNGSGPPLPIELNEEDLRRLREAGYEISSEAESKAREAEIRRRRRAPSADESAATGPTTNLTAEASSIP